MEEWWSLRYLLPAIAGGLGVFILIVTAQSTKNNNKCDFGIAPLSILLLGTIIFTYGAYALFFENQPNDGLNDDVWLKPFFIMASIIFIGFTLDSWKRQILWSNEGLKVKRFLRPDLFISWNEVEDLNYNDWTQWWKLKFTDGRSVIFYDMMRGSKHLIHECNHRIIP